MRAKHQVTVTRRLFPYWQAIDARWRDNDIYGHVNNAVYYTYIDTIINGYMIENKVLDPWSDNVVGFVVESHCSFLKPLRYPVSIDGGLRVEYLGKSSVRYEVGMFQKGDNQAAAVGGFTHVFVDRSSDRPTPIPGKLRSVLAKLLVSEKES